MSSPVDSYTKIEDYFKANDGTYESYIAAHNVSHRKVLITKYNLNLIYDPKQKQQARTVYNRIMFLANNYKLFRCECVCFYPNANLNSINRSVLGKFIKHFIVVEPLPMVTLADYSTKNKIDKNVLLEKLPNLLSTISQLHSVKFPYMSLSPFTIIVDELFWLRPPTICPYKSPKNAFAPPPSSTRGEYRSVNEMRFYRAPEWNAVPLFLESDCWSLGTILAEYLIFGGPMFGSLSVRDQQVRTQMIMGPAPPFLNWPPPPKCPTASFPPLIADLLSWDPRKRPLICVHVSKQIMQFVGEFEASEEEEENGDRASSVFEEEDYKEAGSDEEVRSNNSSVKHSSHSSHSVHSAHSSSKPSYSLSDASNESSISATLSSSSSTPGRRTFSYEATPNQNSSARSRSSSRRSNPQDTPPKQTNNNSTPKSSSSNVSRGSMNPSYAASVNQSASPQFQDQNQSPQVNTPEQRDKQSASSTSSKKNRKQAPQPHNNQQVQEQSPQYQQAPVDNQGSRRSSATSSAKKSQQTTPSSRSSKSPRQSNAKTFSSAASSAQSTPSQASRQEPTNNPPQHFITLAEEEEEENELIQSPQINNSQQPQPQQIPKYIPVEDDEEEEEEEETNTNTNVGQNQDAQQQQQQQLPQNQQPNVPSSPQKNPLLEEEEEEEEVNETPKKVVNIAPHNEEESAHDINTNIPAPMSMSESESYEPHVERRKQSKSPSKSNIPDSPQTFSSSSARFIEEDDLEQEPPYDNNKPKNNSNGTNSHVTFSSSMPYSSSNKGKPSYSYSSSSTNLQELQARIEQLAAEQGSEHSSAEENFSDSSAASDILKAISDVQTDINTYDGQLLSSCTGCSTGEKVSKTLKNEKEILAAPLSSSD